MANPVVITEEVTGTLVVTSNPIHTSFHVSNTTGGVHVLVTDPTQAVEEGKGKTEIYKLAKVTVTIEYELVNRIKNPLE